MVTTTEPSASAHGRGSERTRVRVVADEIGGKVVCYLGPAITAVAAMV